MNCGAMRVLAEASPRGGTRAGAGAGIFRCRGWWPRSEPPCSCRQPRLHAVAQRPWGPKPALESQDSELKLGGRGGIGVGQADK